MIIWPFLTYGIICLGLRNFLPRRHLREICLIAFLCWHALFLVITQALSAVHALNQVNIQISWIGSAVIVCAACFLGPRQRRIASNQEQTESLKADELMLLAGIGTLCVLAFISAIYSAPASFDVLDYHLARVMHWIQNGTTAPYPTHIARQLFNPPLTSYVQTHLYLLSGGDYWANMPQYTAMVLTLCAVSLLCNAFLLSRREMVTAVFLVAALPLGILQASSALNDYTLALWIMCFVLYGYKYVDGQRLLDLSMMAVSAGFICLTKTNGVLVILPFMVYFLVKSRPGLKHGLIGIGIFFAISLPWFIEFVRLKGLLFFPFGFSAWSNMSFNAPQWDVWTNITQHIRLQMSLQRPDEMFAGNLIHVFLIIFFLMFFLYRDKEFSALLKRYLLNVLIGALLAVSLIKYNWLASRFLLPSLILFAPLVSVMIVRSKMCYRILPAMLFLWAVFIGLWYSTRPLLGPHNIFVTPRSAQYVINLDSRHRDLLDAEDGLIAQGCRDIGLNLDLWGEGLPMQREYILWEHLAGQKEKFRIEHVNVENASASYSYPLGEFKPCGIVMSTGKDYFPYHLTTSGIVFTLLKRTGPYTVVYVKESSHE